MTKAKIKKSASSSRIDEKKKSEYSAPPGKKSNLSKSSSFSSKFRESKPPATLEVPKKSDRVEKCLSGDNLSATLALSGAGPSVLSQTDTVLVRGG